MEGQYGRVRYGECNSRTSRLQKNLAAQTGRTAHSLSREDGNSSDRHAVSVMKDSAIVGHVPRDLLQAYWYFIRHGGTISCEVTGSRQRGVGLEVPCVYRLAGSEKLVQRMKSLTSSTK